MHPAAMHHVAMVRVVMARALICPVRTKMRQKVVPEERVSGAER